MQVSGYSRKVLVQLPVMIVTYSYANEEVVVLVVGSVAVVIVVIRAVNEEYTTLK